jgi:hypothetical protein
LIEATAKVIDAAKSYEVDGRLVATGLARCLIGTKP